MHGRDGFLTFFGSSSEIVILIERSQSKDLWLLALPQSFVPTARILDSRIRMPIEPTHVSPD